MIDRIAIQINNTTNADRTYLVGGSDVSNFTTGTSLENARVATAEDFAGIIGYDLTTLVLSGSPSPNPTLVIDGVTLAVGNRALVKNRTGFFATNNGIYSVLDVGSFGGPAPNRNWQLQRTDDFNESSDILEDSLITSTEGAANAGTTFQLITPPPYVLDATRLNWTSVFTTQGDVTFAEIQRQISKRPVITKQIKIRSDNTNQLSQTIFVSSANMTGKFEEKEIVPLNYVDQFWWARDDLIVIPDLNIYLDGNTTFRGTILANTNMFMSIQYSPQVLPLGLQKFNANAMVDRATGEGKIKHAYDL